MNIEYTYDENYTLTIKVVTTFTNVNDEPYSIREFEVDVGKYYPRQISAYDDRNNEINFVVSKNDKGRSIRLMIPDVKLTKDGKYDLTLVYSLQNTSIKYGATIRVFDLPLFLSTSSSITGIRVIFPKSLGVLIYSSYRAYDLEEEEDNYLVNISKFEPHSPIFIVGRSESFRFSINSINTNISDESKYYSYYLPVSDGKQTIVYNDFKVFPAQKVYDKNLLVKYVLTPGELLDINFSGHMLTKQQLGEDIEIYQNAELLDNEIIELIEKNIVSCDKPPSEKYVAIYDFLKNRVVLTDNNPNQAYRINDLTESLFANEQNTMTHEELINMFFYLLQNSGVNSHISWGIVFPYFIKDAKPQIYSWICVSDESDKEYILDLSFEISNGINGIFTNRYDRITVYNTNSLWDQSFSYNNDSVEYFGFDIQSTPYTDVEVSINVPTHIFYNSYFVGNVSVTNLGNTIVNEIVVETTSKDLDLFINEDEVTTKLEFCDLCILPGENVLLPFLSKTNIASSIQAEFLITSVAQEMTEYCNVKNELVKASVMSQNDPQQLTLSLLSVFIILLSVAIILVTFIHKRSKLFEGLKMSYERLKQIYINLKFKLRK